MRLFEYPYVIITVLAMCFILMGIIGLYFAMKSVKTAKEEAEKAVLKLKAWKRLKDAGLKFTDFNYNLDETSSSTISADGKICFEMICYKYFSDDLDLLFGGEE